MGRKTLKKGASLVISPEQSKAISILVSALPHVSTLKVDKISDSHLTSGSIAFLYQPIVKKMIPRGDHWAWNQSNARILYPLTSRIHLSLFKLNPRSISSTDDSDDEDKNSKDKPSYKLWIYQLSLNENGDEKTSDHSNLIDFETDVLNNVVNSALSSSSSSSKKNDGFVISFIWCEKGRDPDLDYLNDLNAFKFNYSYISKCNEDLKYTKPEPKVCSSKPIRKQKKYLSSSSSSSSRPKTRSAKYQYRSSKPKISYAEIDDDDDYDEEDDYEEKDEIEEEEEVSYHSSSSSSPSNDDDDDFEDSENNIDTSPDSPIYSPVFSPTTAIPISSHFQPNIVEVAGGNVEQILNNNINNNTPGFIHSKNNNNTSNNNNNSRSSFSGNVPSYPNWYNQSFQLSDKSCSTGMFYPTIYDQAPSSWMTSFTPIPAISCGSAIPLTENSYCLTPKPRQWEFKFDNYANNASMDNFKRNNFPLDDLFTY